MKTSWIVLIGIGTAVLYGLVSHEVSGSWNFTLVLEIGVVVALALSGFRLRPVEGEAGLGQRSRSTAESESNSDDQPVDATHRSSDLLRKQPSAGGYSSRQKKEAPSFVVRDGGIASTKELSVQSPPPPPFPTSPAAPAADAEALWERARVMVHGVIPDPEEDAEYLDLVFSAAEQGHVPALAKLGDYAFRRKAFVEAYFWTKVAKRRLEMEGGVDPQGLKEIDNRLLNIRRAWSMDGQPMEFENVYENFPEERGELGRAFLRIDIGVEVKPTQEYIQALAEKGNPDAALFV